MRTGVIAQKLGMTSIYTDLGEQVPVTVLKLDGCQVISVQTEEKNGYVALQLGAGKAKVKNVSKPVRGHYAKAKVAPKAHVAEFRVGKDAVLEVGSEITADHFVPGQFVDVSGITLGHGFSGAMKRWNFKGLRATHGVSVTHRAHGSTGQRQDPGKVFKGKKMAGHWGAEKATVQNLKVVSVDPELGYVMVQGAVPGHKNCWLTVKDAVKKKLPKEAPFPAKFRAGAPVEAQAESKSEEKKG